MVDDLGQKITAADPATPVEVAGFGSTSPTPETFSRW